METWHGSPANCLWCGPTLTQTKEIAWEDLKAMVPKEYVAKISETELKITTHFGSTLKVAGLDKPHRIEGSGYDFVVVDERADVKPEAISRSIIPALLERKGKLWEIGVPKRFGVGAESYNKKFDEIQSGVIKNGIALEWESAEVVEPAELEELRGSMTAEDFDEQFRAMVLTIGGQVYYAFSDGPEGNVKPNKYNPNLPIVVGSDMNMTPHCWNLGHQIGDEYYVFAEIALKNSNTQKMLDRLNYLYKDHTKGWFFHGDASSRANKTSANESDYVQIVNDARFAPKRVIYPNANPAIEDRLAATNAMLCNANGERRLFIDPSCVVLLSDLKNRARKEGKRELNDSPMTGHMSDALDYVMYVRFPVHILASRGKAKVGLV